MLRRIIIATAFLLPACGYAATPDSDFMCDQMDARDVLTVLKERGADLSKPREGVFYFYGASDALMRLENGLRALGFSVRPTNTDPGRIATINAVIDEAWLKRMIPQICKLSTDLGVEYDGWEASIPEQQGAR